MTKYPYEDLDSDQLPNEVWKPLIDYEGYYEVSNLGRVRSIDRVIPHPRIKSQFVKGRILKQKIVVNKNSISDEPMVDLQVTLSANGKMRYRNVRRLVYTTFIKKLNYKRDKKYVVNKNCNGYDNSVENVVCVTKKEKSKRAFDRGRVPESYLATADRTGWINPGSLQRKPVRQLTMRGSEVAVFESITEAYRVTGMDEKGIIDVAKGRRASIRGFKWEYVNEKDKLGKKDVLKQKKGANICLLYTSPSPRDA